MRTKEEMLLLSKYEDEILDVIYNQDEYTTSDLQGVVGAIVYRIYLEGQKAATKKEA